MAVPHAPAGRIQKFITTVLSQTTGFGNVVLYLVRIGCVGSVFGVGPLLHVPSPRISIIRPIFRSMRDFRIVVLGMNFIPFGVMKAKRWIVAVAMWMLVFAAVLWFESGVLKREGMRFFRFYVSASQAGSVQVFFDRGHGFREEDSVRRRVPENERQNIVILLEPGVYKGFRIDPVDNGSAYELSSMEITRVYGSSDQSFEAAAWFSHGTGWRIEDGRIIGGGGSDSADPWHALALEPPLNVEPINSGFRHSLSAVLAQHGRALILLALVMLLGPSAGLLGSVAFFFRVVFDPGFYSPDSIDQVSQAQIGQFWDQHPVAMALFLQAWLKIGLTIRDLIFVQALAGLLGVQYTAMRVLDWMPNIQRSWRPWIACLIAVLLCTPLSPLPWYLNTLWKDTWTAILFVWVGGIALRMVRDLREPGQNPWLMGCRWLGCFALMQSIVDCSAFSIPTIGTTGPLIRITWESMSVGPRSRSGSG